MEHHASRFGERGAKIETLTGSVLLDDQWQYTHFIRHGDAQDKKLHFGGSAGLRGGWNTGLGVYFETFGFDQGLYSNYRMLSPAGDTLPFTGRPRITNRDYVFSLTTPQWSRFSGNVLYIGGQDENFFEWAQANIDLIQLGTSFRPSNRARIDATLAYQDYWRRTDHTLVGRNEIPRVKLEYQVTSAAFLRLVGEYDMSENDDLRDEGRTFYPLLVGGKRALAARSHSLHGDFLFSYKPTPGTVLFLGYGTEADGNPDPTQRFTWQPLRRASDYLFVKYSYLLRI